MLAMKRKGLIVQKSTNSSKNTQSDFLLLNALRSCILAYCKLI